MKFTLFNTVLAIWYLWVVTTSPLLSQVPVTETVLSEEDFIDWVLGYHPLAKKARLMDQWAIAQYMKAQGTLDPVLYGNYDDKSFDNKNYYQIGEVGLKVPTWFGVDLKMSYNWANGDFLNPGDNLPSSGQVIAGVEVPLVQGFLFDKRRAEIQKARWYEEANAESRNLMINDLLIEAVEAYWAWSLSYQVLEVYNEAVQLAEERFENVKQSFIQGYVPAIDTLESLIQVQDRMMLKNKAELDYQKSSAELANYLWYDNMVPLELSASARPQLDIALDIPFDSDNVEKILANISETHPKIRKIDVISQQLEVEERLKKEMLKPRLNFNYNFLSNGIDFVDTESPQSLVSDILTENYKWGVSLKFPLRLRKERAELQLVRLQQAELNFERTDAENSIQNKIRATHQQLVTTFQQVMITRDMEENYQLLLDAENEKFRIGESSIFLINSREQKLIDVRIKLRQLETEYQQLLRRFEWVQGQLYAVKS